MNQKVMQFVRERFRTAGYKCENECCPNRTKMSPLKIFWPRHKKWPRSPKASDFYTTQVLCDACWSLAEWTKKGRYPLRQSPVRLDRDWRKAEQMLFTFDDAA